MTTHFEHYCSRLTRVKIFDDIYRDFDLINAVSSFELHVFGIVNQYQRIQKVVKQFAKLKDKPSNSKHNSSQMKLDIYYYFLTWDKLIKIFDNIKSQINKIVKEAKTTEDFVSDYRKLRKKMDNLFHKDDFTVRNAYEHPSLKFHKQGSIVLFGCTMINDKGITVHVGGNVYGNINKARIDQLNLLRIDLIDLFIKHFTDKRTTKELIKMRMNFIKEVNKYITHLQKTGVRPSNDSINNFMSAELFFSIEELPLPARIHKNFYTLIY